MFYDSNHLFSNRFKTLYFDTAKNGILKSNFCPSLFTTHLISPNELFCFKFQSSCQKLIEEYDPHVYKNWFSKLIPIIDKESKYITLKASNKFIMDWIKSNYEDSIRKVTTEIGMKLKEINV